MYWFEAFLRDGWRGFKIYWEVRTWHLRKGTGLMSIDLDSVGFQLLTPLPETSFAHHIITVLAKKRHGSETTLTADWLAAQETPSSFHNNGLYRLEALNQFVRDTASRRKGTCFESDALTAIPYQLGVVTLESQGPDLPIVARTTSSLTWRIHQIRRWIRGWRKPYSRTPSVA